MRPLIYSVTRSPKRRTVAIQVSPDLSINVIAPSDTGDGELAAIVDRRHAWIERQRAYFRSYHPLPAPARYAAGETHYFLGRQYRLRIAEKMPSTMVGIVGEYIEVLLRGPAMRNAVERALSRWYRAEARRVLDERMESACNRMRRHDVARPTLQLRSMPGRWGSCTRSGAIALNPALVRVPVHCIDYVLLHELCHLRYHDHGDAFDRLLSRVIPDWRKIKRQLERWTEVLSPA